VETHGEISKVDGRPGKVLGHAGDGVDDDFSRGDEDDVDHPCAFGGHHELSRVGWNELTFAVDPFCVDVGVRGLVEGYFI
jgi:hypothetical protein